MNDDTKVAPKQRKTKTVPKQRKTEDTYKHSNNLLITGLIIGMFVGIIIGDQALKQSYEIELIELNDTKNFEFEDFNNTKNLQISNLINSCNQAINNLDASKIGTARCPINYTDGSTGFILHAGVFTKEIIYNYTISNVIEARAMRINDITPFPQECLILR